MRRTKDNYYLDIAETVAERSTCLRKQYGAVLVKHDEIITVLREAGRTVLISDLAIARKTISHGERATLCVAVLTLKPMPL